jgi:hypothetical protein
MGLRIRVVFEATLAATFVGLFLLTLLWPDWIETAFGLDLDQRQGNVERMVVALVGLCSVAFCVLARRDWSRYRSASGAR